MMNSIHTALFLRNRVMGLSAMGLRQEKHVTYMLQHKYLMNNLQSPTSIYRSMKK